MWAKFITKNPTIFPPEDNPLDWLMFFAQYLCAIASFAMIVVTAASLKLNRDELNEMKRQWEEEHRPELIAHMVTHENNFYICIKNISNVPVKNIQMQVTHVPPQEKNPFSHAFLESVTDSTFSIEPKGVRYINTFVPSVINVLNEEYIGLKFTYDHDNEYGVDIPFQEANFLAENLEERSYRKDIHNISTEIQKLQRKVK
jgi:hypothetical protein